MKKLRVGILGATGMVGQRFLELLSDHPWFEVVCVAASPQSAGKTYSDAVNGKWRLESPIPESARNLIVSSVIDDNMSISQKVDFVFCALDLEKQAIKQIEEVYAANGVPVVSNNSANRWTEDVPMIIPEVNQDHVRLINIQRKKRNWTTGFIAVKPNCSIQSYVAILTALKNFKPKKIHVTSLQAISGAGKTFAGWPEMVDNLIPFIDGEEEKSEREPLKIWGSLINGGIRQAVNPKISATCIRVPVSNGHMAAVSVSFEKKLSKSQIVKAIRTFHSPIAALHLPSAPKEFIHYFDDENRPQTKLDRTAGDGMGITMGRLKSGKHFDWEFIALSHNTIRGAAGGAILMAELLVKKGYIRPRP